MAINVIQQSSPGIVINELEYTRSDTNPGKPLVGAFVGSFSWGPINSPVLITNNAQLKNTFAYPTTDTEEISTLGSSFFTAYNYLAYQGSKLYVSRAAGANSRNSYDIEVNGYTDYSLGGVTSTTTTANTANNGVYLYVADDSFSQGLDEGMKVFKTEDYLNGRNNVLYTQELNASTYWARSYGSVITRDSVAAPIGASGNTADFIKAHTAVQNHGVLRAQSTTKNAQFLPAEGIIYDSATNTITSSPYKTNSKLCFSTYVKPSGNCNRVMLTVYPTLERQSSFSALFYLNGSGSVLAKSSKGVAAQSANNATITSVGSAGWYRCSIACNANTTLAKNAGLISYGIYMSQANTLPITKFAGNGTTDGLYIWGIQSEPVNSTITANTVPKAYVVNSNTVYRTRKFDLGNIVSLSTDGSDAVIELSERLSEDVEEDTNLVFQTENFDNELKILNEEDLSIQLKTANVASYGPFVARYCGDLGDSIKVAVCTSSNNFSTWTETVNDEVVDYSEYFEEAPGTSQYVQNLNFEDEITGEFNYGQNDELHILVIDKKGKFTGRAGSILEKFKALSKASDVIGPNGRNYYFKDYINKHSNYIYCLNNIDPENTNSTWGKPCTKVSSFASVDNYIADFDGGVNDLPTAAEINSAWNDFKEIDNYNFDSVLTGDASDSDNTILDHVYDNIVKYRKDCVMFVSPPSDAVIEQSGEEANNIIDFFTNTFTKKSSYIVADNNWKYQYDSLNRVYRWVPMNGDVAGLCARTDKNQDAWYSPAGYNRGKILNVTKIAWNANKQDRDKLYKKSINPIITQTGEGTLLFGDKTLMNKSSVFGHINVRRLFLTLEKTISKAAKLQMFDFNDAFTRARFVAMIEPFLREVQGRRGITDFKVVCDETNNTQEIIDDNYFVADIYIKPALSINYIQLNFIAVPQGVEFNTIVL